MRLTPLSVVSTDRKKNNLTAWNCITADLRPDTITQPAGLQKAVRAAACKSQFPHRILKILETPRGAGRQLLPHVHTEPPAVIYSGLDPTRAPTDGSREPRGKENNVKCHMQKELDNNKNSVAADSFYWSVCVFWDQDDRERFSLFTALVWDSVIGTRTLEWDAPQREGTDAKWRKYLLFHL